MNKKIVIVLAVTAVVFGFGLALAAAKVHSTFFVFLPIAAFLSGYFTSWRTGLLGGFLLFISYSFSLALMWEVRYAMIGFAQYIGAFMVGGFSILLVGAIAPVVKLGFKHAGTIVTLAILAITLGGCVYISIPRYHYSSGLMIMCGQDMELYIPAETARYDFGNKLLATVTDVQSMEKDWSDIQLKETEYGKMWNLKLTSHLEPGVTANGRQILGRSSNWYKHSSSYKAWPGISPKELVTADPKSGIHELNITGPETLAWPAFVTADKTLAEFNVPLKVITATPTKFDIYLYYSTSKKANIGFGYYKEESYHEVIDHYTGTTGNEWIPVPAESKLTVSIRGIGD